MTADDTPLLRQILLYGGPGHGKEFVLASGTIRLVYTPPKPNEVVYRFSGTMLDGKEVWRPVPEEPA